MNMRIVKLVVGILWTGAAISSAASADAYALTTQMGSYATCSSSYTVGGTQCLLEGISNYSFPYVQQIKFVTSSNCNTGGCVSEPGTVYVQSVYASGRKTTRLETTCGGKRMYSLGTCAC